MNADFQLPIAERLKSEIGKGKSEIIKPLYRPVEVANRHVTAIVFEPSGRAAREAT